MPWRTRFTRVMRFKERQAESRLSQATWQKDVAEQNDAEAAALMDTVNHMPASDLAVDGSGLTRMALYARLHMIAVTRAHTIEVNQRAEEHKQSAQEAREKAAELLREAARHRKKVRKIDAWMAQERRRRHLREEKREGQLLQEEYSCRFRR